MKKGVKRMIRTIAVCDDEQDISRQLSHYFKQIQEETGDKFQISYYGSAEELLQFMPRDTEVLLLDIRMGDLTGMEAARRLRAEGVETAILFVTSMTEYAMDGYEVHAFSFLQKPVQYAALRRQLLEVFGRIDRERGARLIVNDGVSSEVVDLIELIYAEVFQHDTSFVFTHGRKSYKIALSDIERQIAHHGFFRCHKSYLVNFHHIKRLEFSEITMSNGEKLPVSKHRRNEFLVAYSRFMGVEL